MILLLYVLQFVVVQGGCRKKIKFDGISPLVGKTTSTHVRLESPWVHHFKATGKSHSLTFDAQRNGVPSSERVRLESDLVFSTESASSGHNFVSNLCHYDSIGSNKGTCLNLILMCLSMMYLCLL